MSEEKKNRIQEFLGQLSEKLQVEDGEADGKKRKFVVRLEKKSDEFLAIVKADMELEALSDDFEELLNSFHKTMIERKRSRRKAWGEVSLKYGLAGKLELNRATGDVFQVEE